MSTPDDLRIARRRPQALALALVLAFLSGCASSETLPGDAPVSEPGYATRSATVGSEPTSATTDPAPTTTPSTAAPSSGGNTGTRPEAPDATPPAAPATPTQAAPTTSSNPSQIVLATAEWLPECGGDAAPPDPNPNLTLTLDAAFDITAGGELHTVATLANTYSEPIQEEGYYVIVTITQNGTVISSSTAGASSATLATLGAGETMGLQVDQTLLDGCAGDAASGVAVDTSADATVTQPTADPSPTATEPTPATTTPAEPSALPPGTYDLSVTVHVARNNGVVAVARSVLTISTGSAE